MSADRSRVKKTSKCDGNFLLPSDVTSLQFAIQSGVPEAVSALLDGMTDDAQRVAQLTRRYGGSSSGDIDDDGLLDGTNPILHAARIFNSDIFGLILTAMKRFLAPRQVKEAILVKDIGNRTLMAMAACSWSHDCFRRVLDALTSDLLSKDEINEMMRSEDMDGKTLLMHAVGGGIEIFKAVLNGLHDNLSSEEMKEVITARDENGYTLLEMALKMAYRSKSQDCFELAFAEVRQSLTSKEMQENITAKDARGRTLLVYTAKAGVVGIFTTVLNELRQCEQLSAEEFRNIVAWEDGNGNTILAVAASSGSQTAFKAVFDALDKDLNPSEVNGMLNLKVLTAATESGSTETWATVLQTTRERLTLDQVVSDTYESVAWIYINISAVICASEGLLCCVTDPPHARLTDEETFNSTPTFAEVPSSSKLP